VRKQIILEKECFVFFCLKKIKKRIKYNWKNSLKKGGAVNLDKNMIKTRVRRQTLAKSLTLPYLVLGGFL